MNVTEAVQFNNISATTAPFALEGGRYAVSVIGTSFGTVGFEGLGADNLTYQPEPAIEAYPALTSGLFAAAGQAVFDVPPGQYKIVISSTTGVYVNICRVPV